MLDTLFGPFLAEPLPWAAGTLAVFTAFLLGFARSSFGGGGFVVSPLMVLAVGPRHGLALIAVLMLAAGARSCWQHRHGVDPRLLRPLLLAAITGTVLGGVGLGLLVYSGEETLVHRRLETVVAFLTLLYTGLVLARDRIARGGPDRPPRPRETWLAGNLVAISQVLANSGSPLLTVFFLRFHRTKESFVPAQAFFLAAQNAVKLVPLALLHLLHLGNLGTALLLFPVTLFGGQAGHWFFRRYSERALLRFYAGTLVLGALASLALLVGRERLLGLL